MNKLLYFIILILFVDSCKKDDPDVFDFTISKIEKIDARVEETRTLRISITSNNVDPENVYLSLEDVPQGLTYTFSQVAGVPEFTTNLVIHIDRSIEGGLHTLRLIGNSSKLTREIPIEITVDKSLSAAFTVYNAINYDPDDARSNLADSAIIKLYANEASFLSGIPEYQDTTSEEGRAFFYKLPVGTYLFTVEKGDLSNVIQKRNVGGLMTGFVVSGMFRTLEEIINSAQPKAKLGDLKLRDLNADNKIDDSDLGRYDYMSIYEGEMNEKVIWMGK